MKHTKARAFSVSHTESESTQAGLLEDEHSSEAHISSPVHAHLTRRSSGQNGQRENDTANMQSPLRTTSASGRRPNSSVTTGSSANTGTSRRSESHSPLSQPPEDLLMLLAKSVFRQGFETTFGALLGRYGCPFV